MRAVDGSSPVNVGAWSSSFYFTITTRMTAVGSLFAGWNMFSTPLQAESGSFSEMLAYSDTSPYVWRYDAGQGSYVLASTADVGRGYWVKAGQNTPFLFEGTSVSSSSEFELSLGGAWNMIGNPFNVDMSWNSVRVRKDGVTKTIIEAQIAGWMRQYIFNYNPMSGSYEVKDISNGVLRPYLGYWVKATAAGVKLVFAPV